MIPRRVRIKRVARPKRGGPLKRGKGVRRVSAKRPRVNAEDEVWRKYVRDVAEGLCERSGYIGSDAHHIWPKQSHPKLRHVTLNGIFLTRKEHNRAHADMKAFRAWFAEHFPESWRQLEEKRLELEAA